MSRFDNWLKQTLGQKIDLDGDNSIDCVDIPESWSKYLWPDVPASTTLGYGDAKDHFANASSDYFDKLQGITPVQGDIVVFGATKTNSYGHIAVVISADGSGMTVIEQNSYTQAAAYQAWHNYNNIIGYLRPKVAEGEEMIQDIDNEYARWEKAAKQIRGRRQGFTRDEFRQAAVGRTWLQALEILSDDPESDANYQYGRIVDDDMTNLIYEVVLHRVPEGPDAYNAWRGRPIVQVINEVKNSDEGKSVQQESIVKNKIISDLQTQLAKAGGTIDPKTQAKIDQINTTTQSTNVSVNWLVSAIKKVLAKLKIKQKG